MHASRYGFTFRETSSTLYHLYKEGYIHRSKNDQGKTFFTLNDKGESFINHLAQ